MLSMFAWLSSKTIPRQLARGAAGLSLLHASPALAALDPLLPLLSVLTAILILRGCPLCWLVGLARLLITRAQGAPADGLCLDGSCALPDKG
jgi:hypothetical protein